jgi:hypothetical protein
MQHVVAERDRFDRQIQIPTCVEFRLHGVAFREQVGGDVFGAVIVWAP